MSFVTCYSVRNILRDGIADSFGRYFRVLALTAGIRQAARQSVTTAGFTPLWNMSPSSSTIAKQTQTGVIGKPFNVASYALFTMMVAQACDQNVGEFVPTLGDAHIYSNHFEQLRTQLASTPGPLSIMKINQEARDLFAFDDFKLEGYSDHYPTTQGGGQISGSSEDHTDIVI